MTEETAVDTQDHRRTEVRDTPDRWDSPRQRRQDGSLDIARSIWGNGPQGDSSNFQYLNERLDCCWVTNVPNTLDEALDYFCQLLEWGIKARYVEMKDIGEDKFSLQPFEFDPETLVLKNFKTEEVWTYGEKGVDSEEESKSGIENTDSSRTSSPSAAASSTSSRSA